MDILNNFLFYESAFSLPKILWNMIGEYLISIKYTVYENWAVLKKEMQMNKEMIQKYYDLPWHRTLLENEKITIWKIDPFLLFEFENNKKQKNSKKRKDRYRPYSWIINMKRKGTYKSFYHHRDDITERNIFNCNQISNYRQIGVLGFNECLEHVGDASNTNCPLTFRNTSFEVKFTEEELNEIHLSLYILRKIANVNRRRRKVM